MKDEILKYFYFTTQDSAKAYILLIQNDHN